ncbi:MAG: tetratricopeptide repeat protein [Candidatus Thorarchaeota archaeon]|nr:MAG: tetratricopeptide repeat protein [Candidatus Thorarchaeota archaeon]
MVMELLAVLVIIVFAAALPHIVPRIMIQGVGYALSNRPNDHEGWTYLGELFIKTGQYDRAIYALNKAVLLRPDYSEAWLKLGDVYTILGNSERAMEAYGLAIDSEDFSTDS